MFSIHSKQSLLNVVHQGSHYVDNVPPLTLMIAPWLVSPGFTGSKNSDWFV